MPPLGIPALADNDYNTPESLWAELEGEKVLTVPHHTSNEQHYLRPDLFHKDEFVPVVEIFQSNRGTCETHEGPGATEYTDIDDERCYVQSALEDGARLGFVAGGDHIGLAHGGVWVEELTREGIYRALQERHCFATTGTGIALETSVGDVSMGGVLETTAEEVEYSIDAEVPDGLQRVEILRNNEVVHEIDVEADRCRADVRVSLEGTDEQWVYSRLLLTNGEVAWSSPIWIERP